MKSFRFILFGLLLALSIPGLSQMKIGIKVSPGITPVRTSFPSDTMTVNDEGAPLRMMAGIVVDYALQDNYEVRTGINFVSKLKKYNITGDTPGVRYNDEVVMQYLQVPLTMKLNTNEIMLDTKVYVQLGASLDIRIHDNIEELTNPLVTEAGFIDTSMIIAAGVDRRLGTETKAFAGFVYQRAFLNQAKSTIPLDADFKMQTAFIGLEIGVIF